MSAPHSTDGLKAVLFQLLPGLLIVGLLLLGLCCRKKLQSELQTPLLKYAALRMRRQ